MELGLGGISTGHHALHIATSVAPGGALVRSDLEQRPKAQAQGDARQGLMVQWTSHGRSLPAQGGVFLQLSRRLSHIYYNVTTYIRTTGLIMLYGAMTTRQSYFSYNKNREHV